MRLYTTVLRAHVHARTMYLLATPGKRTSVVKRLFASHPKAQRDGLKNPATRQVFRNAKKEQTKKQRPTAVEHLETLAHKRAKSKTMAELAKAAEPETITAPEWMTSTDANVLSFLHDVLSSPITTKAADFKRRTSELSAQIFTLLLDSLGAVGLMEKYTLDPIDAATIVAE